jgi:hypothetical protein
MHYVWTAWWWWVSSLIPLLVLVWVVLGWDDPRYHRYGVDRS